MKKIFLTLLITNTTLGFAGSFPFPLPTPTPTPTPTPNPEPTPRPRPRPAVGYCWFSPNCVGSKVFNDQITYRVCKLHGKSYGSIGSGYCENIKKRYQK